MALRTEYTKLQWVNDQTRLNEFNLNHIEAGVYANNLLSLENANYIDEIFSAIVEKLGFEYSAQTGKLNFSIGDNTLVRFKATKEIWLKQYFYDKTEVDAAIQAVANTIVQDAITIEDTEYVIPEEDK